MLHFEVHQAYYFPIVRCTKLTCLNPGTSLMMVPSVLTQVIFGSGVPRLWQMISAPVVLEKSTWLGGSWTKTGPDTSLWAETEMEKPKIKYLTNYLWCQTNYISTSDTTINLYKKVSKNASFQQLGSWKNGKLACPVSSPIFSRISGWTFKPKWKSQK